MILANPLSIFVQSIDRSISEQNLASIDVNSFAICSDTRTADLDK